MDIEKVIGILVSITAVSSYVNYRYLKLPKSIGITLVTLSLCLILTGLGYCGLDVDDFAKDLLEGIGFDKTFLDGMLGFLLFAASLHVNARELAKHRVIVGLLATLSVLLSTALVGFCTYGLTQFLNIHIPLSYCLVFGALISPTDPIAALGVLRRVKAPKALEMKIAGEALFNDGMGIVLFSVLLGFATGEKATWVLGDVTLAFIWETAGGFIFGFILGGVASRLLRSLDNDEVAIILTLSVVTGGYSLAKVVNISGPICMAVAGLYIGSCLQNCNMSKSTLVRLNAFWELLDELLNALLFVLIGLEVMSLPHFTKDTAIAALGAIVITIAARWISVVIPVGYVSLYRKYDPNVVLVMTWGGLRGGISIALALGLSDTLGPTRDFIVTVTYAAVLFSMTVQALTLGSLVRKLSKVTEPILPTTVVHHPHAALTEFI